MQCTYSYTETHSPTEKRRIIYICFPFWLTSFYSTAAITICIDLSRSLCMTLSLSIYIAYVFLPSNFLLLPLFPSFSSAFCCDSVLWSWFESRLSLSPHYEKCARCYPTLRSLSRRLFSHYVVCLCVGVCPSVFLLFSILFRYYALPDSLGCFICCLGFQFRLNTHIFPGWCRCCCYSHLDFWFLSHHSDACAHFIFVYTLHWYSEL